MKLYYVCKACERKNYLRRDALYNNEKVYAEKSDSAFVPLIVIGVVGGSFIAQIMGGDVNLAIWYALWGAVIGAILATLVDARELDRVDEYNEEVR